MVQIWFPGLKFNGARLTAGQLLDVWLLGINLKIPPWDIEILPPMTFWEPFLIFDSDWIVGSIAGLVTGIPAGVWGWMQKWIQEQIDEYYKAHPERKPT